MRDVNYFRRRIDSPFLLLKGGRCLTKSVTTVADPRRATMARKVSTETRQDLLQAVQERYRGSLKEEKLRILDEFVAVTGYHRKHIIRLFNAAPVAVRFGRRARLPVYDDA